MKGVLISIIFLLLLISFVLAVSITSKATEDLNDSSNGNQEQTQTQNEGNDSEIQTQNQENDEEDNETGIEDEECEKWKCTQWSACLNRMKTRNCVQVNNLCSEEQEKPKISKRCEAKERIKLHSRITECPEECTCSGSTIKCVLQNGREMTIFAGKSGNVIIQIEGINMSTNVTLYRGENGTLHGIFKNNKTKEIKMLPDQVRERIRERLRTELQNENITLNEDGSYNYQAKERARLFFIIPVRVRVAAEINPETGEVIRLRKAWWAFLAKGEDDMIVGGSCGTVTPGYNDGCCKNKGYDVWNAETAECEFNIA